MEPRGDSRNGVAPAATTQELRELGTGMTLGRYTLVRKVAAGGMAEVYAARSQGISGFEKKVAIKKILPQFSLNKRFVDMLVDEAKIAVSLTHPNIAQILELGLDGETYYIVMEYVDGRPLNHLMRRLDLERSQNVPIEHAAHIMAEVAKGLHNAHNQTDARGNQLQIVHRDISPQNVLLAYTGDVKVIDFGIARAAGRVAQTSAGTIKGKLRYLAPEIAMGDEPDHRADVYCCGIVLFEMLTGEALFAPRTDVEAIEMAIDARVRSPRRSNPAVPHDLEDIVMTALQRDRDLRYASAKDLYTDLRRFLNHHYPAYVGSELGDLMQDVFAPEIAEDRRLDELAEQVIDELDGGRRDPTLGVRLGELAGSEEPVDPELDPDSPSYQPVVTRAEVPLSNPSARAHDDAQSDGDPEPTQRAANPLLGGAPHSDEQTLSGRPPPRPSALPVTAELSASAPGFGETAEVALPLPATAARPGAPPPSSSRVSAPPPGMVTSRPFSRLYLGVAAVVVAVGLWLGFAAVSPTEVEVVPVTPNPLATSDTPERTQRPKPARGSAVAKDIDALVIDVRPDVAVDVSIAGGPVLVTGARSPVVVSGLTAGKTYTLQVKAAGHELATLPYAAVEGSGQVRSQISLVPSKMAIVVRGAGGGRVKASVGRVLGQRVEEIPVGSQVKLTITLPGESPYVRTVTARGSDPMYVDLPRRRPARPARPKATPARKGVLFVNARPRSEVIINGRSKGKTPKKLSLSSGSYTVILKHHDGRVWKDRVRVRSGQKVMVKHRWPRR